MPSDLPSFESEKTRLEGLRQAAADQARRAFEASTELTAQATYDAAVRDAHRVYFEGVIEAARRFEIEVPNVHSGLRHIR